MVLGGLVLGSLIVYLKGMRIMMFQLSGYYCRRAGCLAPPAWSDPSATLSARTPVVRLSPFATPLARIQETCVL